MYLGDKCYILNAANGEEKEAFVQELYIVSITLRRMLFGMCLFVCHAKKK